MSVKVPIRYLPIRLTKKDRGIQAKQLLKSRRLYKTGVYYTRKTVRSFHSQKSNHISNAQKIYHIDTITASKELSKKTKCSIDALKKIVNKGEGAYFSSGSRPNQTAQSWGNARLASAITGGKAAVIDYSILVEGCRANSTALKMAKNAKTKKHRTVKKYKIQ